MNTNNHSLFSSSMKMSDIILDNYALLTVLPRFGINLGFGEQSVGEVCRKCRVNEQLFLLVCNVSTFEEYLPDEQRISELDATALINYLQSSHLYYMNEKIYSIEEQLESMGSSCSDSHNRIINSFFGEYKNEIINHFRYEEQEVFPYVRALIKGCEQGDFNINQYEQNHSNIEDKLSDLKNIIIKYLPENCSSKLRNRVLFEICLFEQDLVKHSLIEDKILVPFVSQLEKSYEQ